MILADLSEGDFFIFDPKVYSSPTTDHLWTVLSKGLTETDYCERLTGNPHSQYWNKLCKVIRKTPCKACLDMIPLHKLKQCFCWKKGDKK